MMKKRLVKKILCWLNIGVILVGGSMGLLGHQTFAAQTDKGALSELLEEAEKLQIDGYTDESIALLQRAMDSARQICGKESAAQTEIDDHVRLLEDVSGALIQKEKEGIIYDGVYQVEGHMWNAYNPTQPSMGNAAVKQPMEVIYKEGKAVLRIEFIPLTAMLGTAEFTGYLGELNYYAGYHKSDAPSDQQPVSVQVESYYEDLYDSYNDRKTGTDSYMKGKEYPRYVRFPADFSQKDYWVQVYVPVMEYISTGSGRQDARLEVDWSTLKQVSGADTDKTSLKAEVTQISSFQKYLASGESSLTFSDELQALLESAVTAGNAALENVNLEQTAVDAVVQAIRSVKVLFGMNEEAPDKSQLESTIAMAKEYLKKNEVYTAATLTALQGAVEKAQTTYDNLFATQAEINDQTAKLALSILGLEKKAVSPTPTPNENPNQGTVSEPGDSGNKDDDPEEVIGDGNLDIKKLKDGVYSLRGTMLKVDKATESMSNEAINHTIRLTVKNGKYTLTLKFSGLTIGTQRGYLSRLKYFKKGYTQDSYGNPGGALGDVTVDSYQTDGNGVRISDTYGTDYPAEVTFPMIAEAKKDGYVPLQVFVPIMEAISAGTGTQAVYLSLNLDTLAKVTDESVFDDPENESSGNDNSGSNQPSGGSSLTGGSGLKASSGLNVNSGLKTTPAASASAGLKKTETKAKSSENTPVLQNVGEETAVLTDSYGEDSEEASENSDSVKTEEEIKQPPLRKYVVPMGSLLFFIAAGAVTWRVQKGGNRRRRSL